MGVFVMDAELMMLVVTLIITYLGYLTCVMT
jgi:hypothetical protein